MYEQFRQERAQMIADSDARLLEARWQAEQERARYEDQVRMREIEIQRLHRVVQAADKNAYESQNAARVAIAKLARAQPKPIGVAPRLATPPPVYSRSPRQSQKASPSRQENICQPANPEGEYQG